MPIAIAITAVCLFSPRRGIQKEAEEKSVQVQPEVLPWYQLYNEGKLHKEGSYT